MAEFGYLVYYKEHPADRAMNMKAHSSDVSKRQRGISTTLSPVMEDEATEVQKKSKRRFSLDVLFSKKKNKQFQRSIGNSKRGSVDSTVSNSSDYDNEAMTPDGESRSRKTSEMEADMNGY